MRSLEQYSFSLYFFFLPNRAARSVDMCGRLVGHQYIAEGLKPQARERVGRPLQERAVIRPEDHGLGRAATASSEMSWAV